MSALASHTEYDRDYPMRGLPTGRKCPACADMVLPLFDGPQGLTSIVFDPAGQGGPGRWECNHKKIHTGYWWPNATLSRPFVIVAAHTFRSRRS